MLHAIDAGTFIALSNSYNQLIMDYVTKYEAGLFGDILEGGQYPISQTGIKIQKQYLLVAITSGIVKIPLFKIKEDKLLGCFT